MPTLCWVLSSVVVQLFLSVLVASIASIWNIIFPRISTLTRKIWNLFFGNGGNDSLCLCSVRKPALDYFIARLSLQRSTRVRDRPLISEWRTEINHELISHFYFCELPSCETCFHPWSRTSNFVIFNFRVLKKATRYHWWGFGSFDLLRSLDRSLLGMTAAWPSFVLFYFACTAVQGPNPFNLRASPLGTRNSPSSLEKEDQIPLQCTTENYTTGPVTCFSGNNQYITELRFTKLLYYVLVCLKLCGFDPVSIPIINKYNKIHHLPSLAQPQQQQ